MDLSNPFILPQPTIRLEQKTIQVNGQPLHFVHPTGDDTIFGTLSCLRNNKFSLDKVSFKEGDVFLDLGSNVGLVSLMVAKVCPFVRVFAFDASPLAVECLKKSAILNGMTNIVAFNLAVGAENQKDVVFYSNGKDQSCLVQEGFNSSNPVRENTVDKVSICEIFDSHLLGIDKVAYLKSDIEGIEYEVFNKLFSERQDILNRIEHLHIEIHPYQELKPDELRDKLKGQFGDRVFFDT